MARAGTPESPALPANFVAMRRGLAAPYTPATFPHEIERKTSCGLVSEDSQFGRTASGDEHSDLLSGWL